MEGEIINKVANSSLITFNLEDYYKKGERKTFDISPFLLEGIVLREKEFRKSVKDFDWSQFQNSYVALHCATDAIVPSWAFMLVSLSIVPFAYHVTHGSLEDLERELFVEELSKISYEDYKDQRVIIKGCSQYPVPELAYTIVAQKLLPFTKSLMFGEACSTVPLYKQSKK